MKKWYKNKILWIIISVIVLIGVAAVIYFCLRETPQEEPALVYDDPVKSFMSAYSETDDSDYDGLLNDEEKQLKTNLFNADTDSDGLGDYYEAKISLTNPLKADTDRDGLNDYVEIHAGLNPNDKMSDGTTPDAERKYSETYTSGKISIEFQGDANIYRVYCAPFEVSGVSKTPGVVSDITEIFIQDKLPATEYTFRYTSSDVRKKGIIEQDLAVYRFTKEGEFEKVQGSTVDIDNNVVYCTLTSSGKYLVCDSRISHQHRVAVMLLIDNSGSMYPEEMCATSPGNDVEFKRLDMAKSIIENISQNTIYGLAKFTKTYTKMNDIGSDKKDLFAQIDSIRTGEEEFNGTFIATSIVNACQEFTTDFNMDRKFIIILTDGATTEGSGLSGWLAPDEHDAIKECNDSNVSVITIALGTETDDEYLQAIANGTGGAYLYANNADALEDLYDVIFKTLLYSTEDVNGDDIVDSYIAADSGFDLERNAFAFDNIALLSPTGGEQNGVCYGMAILAQGVYRRISLGAGDACVGADADKYVFPAYNISNQLDAINNLCELKCEIAQKWTAIHDVETKDRYYNDNGVLRYKPELIAKYADDYLTIQVRNSSGQFGAGAYTQSEMLYINLYGYLDAETQRDDMEIIKALYWLWGSQSGVTDGKGRFGVDTFNMSTDWSDTATESEFDILIDKIKGGIPLVVGFNSLSGGHAVNATRLLRDINNPLVYYLECYDNNDNSAPYFFKIEKSDIDFWTSTTVSNWGENYCYRTYLKGTGGWQTVSLYFTAIAQ